MTDIGSMPLDEALQHYGKKGMKWGVRKSRNEPDWDRQGEDPNKNVKRVVGGTALVVGVAATAIVLRKYGGINVGPDIAGKVGSKFNARNAKKVYDGVVEDGPNMARGTAKAASRFGDIIDAEVVSTGASAVRALPPSVWQMPMKAIAS